ncbi:MAG: anti-sigma factor [Anaerolineales bacterium]|nr:anti-sigma factor [Anaerolineales bacterium]
MTDNHPIFRENLAAYAINALDADETAALQAHLRTCDSCRAELADYQRVSAGLLSALPPQAPPSALKRTLAARLPSAKKPVRPRWQLGWSFGQFATATAFTFLLGMNLFSSFQMRALQTQQAELTRQLEMEQTVLAMIASPGTYTLPVSNSDVTGSLVVNSGNNSAILILSNLPELKEGETYQMWFIEPDNGRVSAGLIDVNRDGSITIASLDSRDSLQAYTGIGVTVEPVGGSDQPTGPKVFGVEF